MEVNTLSVARILLVIKVIHDNIFFQIEDLSSQAQIQAAEKFKAPEATSVAGKEAEQEAVVADGDEEEVRKKWRSCGQSV